MLEDGPLGGATLARRFGAGILLLTLGLTAVLVISAAHGPAKISYGSAAAILLHRVGLSVGSFTETEQRIVEQIRLPRIVTGLFVGFALGVGGSVLQGLFRNPLADPGIIGVSSGAALGAVVAIGTGIMGFHWLALPASAFAGALAVAFSVYAVALTRGRATLMTLVLAGIALSAFASALTSLIITLTEDLQRNREILFWLMGGLDNRSWEHVRLVFVPILLGTAVCVGWARELNLMLLGEEAALSMGVPVPWVRALLLATVAGITAAAVAVSGIISFVGLIVPHVVRLVVGYDHRLVVPFSGLAGAAFLVSADVLARTVMQPAELRVGIVTSALGAPFFAYLIYRNRRERLPV